MQTTNRAQRLTLSPRSMLLRFGLPLTLTLVFTPYCWAFVNDPLKGTIFDIVQQVITQNFGIERWLEILSDPCSERLPMDEQICSATGSGGIDMSGIFKDSTGVLGIPNPNQTRTETSQEIQSKSRTGNDVGDVFEVNPTVYSVYAANQADRLNTRAAIETVLGEDGQKQMKDEIDSTEKTVEGTINDANEAQEMDVTQDVAKKLVRISAQHSVLLGAIRSDAMKARIDTQFTNLNLMNSSRTLDELARARRTESSANAMSLLELSAQSSLH